MIQTVHDMFSGRSCQSSPDGKHWFRAVPYPFMGGFTDRLRDAWAVLTGRAHAVKWPTPGDLERIWYKE